MKTLDTKILLFIALFTTLVSILCIEYAYLHNLILAYGDSESHINIAKRVVSGLTPGFGQLGGAWLPLPHLMMVPFVWNDTMWNTGLAGSIIGGISYVISAIYIYKLIRLLIPSIAISILGTFIFALNPNILYLQTTPLGELPLVCSLILSVYYFMLWTKKGTIGVLALSAAFAFAGSLMRYDAWFLVVSEMAFIVLIGILKKQGYKKTEGSLVIFSTLAVSGILFWLIWNTLIFKDALYFLNSPYSAKSQQLAWLARGELPAYHNIFNSFIFYCVTAAKNTGVALGVASLAGFIMVMMRNTITKGRRDVFVASTLLLSPFIFYVVTLYMGISIVLVPELVPKTFQWNLFNIRYGIVMVPAVAVFFAFLFYKFNVVGRFLLMLVIALQIFLFVKEGTPVTLQDGLTGLSARRPSEATKFVRDNYDYGYVMFDDFARSADPIDLHIPFSQIIYVGNHPYWDNALKNPEKQIRWFIIRKTEGDAIWNNVNKTASFAKNYEQVYRNGEIYVYRRKW